MKNYAFMAGLPRSGSTLLSSILSQNPEIYSGPNSPMCGMMFNLERSIYASEQYAAYPKPEVMSKTVTGLLDGYYSDIDKPFVIDKSREWPLPEHFEMLKRNFQNKIKVIMPVRPIIEVLASFIDLVHRNPSSISFIDREIEARQEFNFYRQTDEIRCDHLMRPKGLIDNCIYGMLYAMQPENKDYFHFVNYGELIENPDEAMSGIYEFLELEPFAHDFNSLENDTPEDDKTYGLRGMHDVRSKLSRRVIVPEEVLPPYSIQKYAGSDVFFSLQGHTDED